MKKLLYIAEGLGLLAIVYVLVGSCGSSDCWCGTSYSSGKGKLAYQRQMLAKYRDKMLMERELPSKNLTVKGNPEDRGYISGTVVHNESPLQGVQVWAYDTSYYCGYGSYTNADGYYVIKNLPEEPTDLYKVTTDNDSIFIDRWYNNKLNFWSADTVRVTAGDTTKNINFNLPLAGYISGQVTDESKGGLKDICVDVYDTDWNFISWGETDSFGFYTVGSMDEGVPYKVNAHKWGSPYVGEWWDDKPDVVFADTVTATSGDTTKNINFVLTLGGCVSGTVTGPGKEPLEGIMIEANSIVNGGFVQTDWWGTDSLGHYMLSGLPLSSGLVGGYRVRTFDAGQYVSQWHSGKYNIRTADYIDITVPGDTIKEVNFELITGGFIVGMVTDGSGDSLPGIGVYIYDNSASNPLEPAAYTSAEWWPVEGQYGIGLLPGDYKVRTANREGFIDEYYDNQTSWDAANLVSVSVKGTTYVDFSLSLGGRIEGTVYEAAKKDGVVPLPRVAVAAIRSNTGEVVTFIQSGLDGAYSIGGLPTGWYKVCAVPWGDMVYSSFTDIIHAFEFYDDKHTLATADSVYVYAPDSVVIGIDFILGAGGAIAGKVSDQPKDPIEGAEVTAFGDGGPYYGWIPVQIPSSTDETGDYVVPGLGTGDYKVRAEAESYPTKWWENKPDSSSADLVSVTAPDTTPDINFYLVGVEEGSQKFIYRLYQNQPNPFSQKTVISYQLPVVSRVSLKIYDITGRLAKLLVNDTQKPGHYTVNWDGTDTNGKKLSSGIYFYRLESGDFKAINKLILLH
ncbi:carboxypeptidase regulatory-like domain-containing protein [candidate division WOR-3 bacterium]|nr:carboxypeptidase regulatory-like domain-containing protein [candidate division WOR-3 bacterium]